MDQPTPVDEHAADTAARRPKYRTTPVETTRMPRGIPYIIGNEAAERFSFYGMRGILTIFMVNHLRDSAGSPDYMSDEDAKAVYHLFVASAYFFPIVGSLISDILWGKYKTILILSLGYCVGHLCLALGDTGIGAGLVEPRNWLFLGLIYIAIGSGGIKPCVSAHVGDQFGSLNQGLLTKTFSWFYFAINVGAAASNLLTPVLLAKVGPWAAFGLPGLLMAVATFVFWLGRNEFIHVPPGGYDRFIDETFSPAGITALKNLSPLFLIFIPMFWALFDQTGSAWVLQATRMDREFLGVNWYESQVQAVNPVLILILIPTFAYCVYPWVGKFIDFTPLRKVGCGLFLMVLGFAVSTWIETRINGGYVFEANSYQDKERWPANSLLDGVLDSQGWISGEFVGLPAAEGDASLPAAGADGEDSSENAVEDVQSTHDIIIRLRENRPWQINSVVVSAQDDLQAFFEDQVGLMNEHPDVSTYRPQRIEVSLADSPKPEQGWRVVGSGTMPREGSDPLRIEIGPQTAQFVKVSISSTWGAPRVALSEIAVNTVEGIGDGSRHRAEVWPNVAATGFRPNIGWQFFAYILVTASEIMVSIVCLEFAYTQAPRKMKSFIMGIFFLGVSLGNLLTAGVNWWIQNEDGTSVLEGANYYWFFTAAMLATAVLYVVWSQFYRGSTYIQGEGD